MASIVPVEDMGLEGKKTDSVGTGATAATATNTNETWEETYLKLLLLYVDKVGFVQSFLVPTFEAPNDLPTKTGVCTFITGFICAIITYFCTEWESFVFEDDTDKHNAKEAGEVDARFWEFYITMWVITLLMLPFAYGGVLFAWCQDVGGPGRLGALMAMAQEKPPKRDHSKPFGLTWYKSLIQVCVYGSVVFVPIAFAAMDAPVMRGIQCGLLILIFTEPLNNINERFWKSTKISDAEVCITAGMQGQCMFAEGGGNAIAVNVNAVKGLKWKNNMREQVLKAAKANKKYAFQIFDTSSGFHTTITLEKMTKIHEEEGSVAKEVMKELYDHRNEFRDMLNFA
jgi:hypothetical protein